jgi:enamine deaminase RidA (YjgF/YER057c/UK114 family)
MAMTQAPNLSFLPFDNVWKMRIDHPYSLIVKDGPLAWSCGQCPLDSTGAVLSPGDLGAQARHVAGFIARYLTEMGTSPTAIGRLVVYYARTASGDAERVKSLFQNAFGCAVQVVMVAVPHFYYDGMLIEVDVFASDRRSGGSRFDDPGSGMILETTDAGPFLWASVSAPRRTAGDLGAGLRRLLVTAGLSLDTVLVQQWFLPVGFDLGDRCLDAAGVQASDAVFIADPEAEIVAELTFAKLAVSDHQPPPGVARGLSITLRRAGGFFAIRAMHAAPDLGLVPQTEAIMRAIGAEFAERGLAFCDVRKSTTHYIAGSAADELHDNMAVRNRCYTRPGPASTGLPVAGFAVPDARIAVTLFGVTSEDGN